MLAPAAAAVIASLTLGSLISSSRIEQCVQTGNGPSELVCERDKFVVALSVENGQNGTETVEATFSQASDDSGTRQLQVPWRIELRKSRVSIRYPITYVRSFNAQPGEQVIVVPSLGCVDGASSASPTCGWAVSNGNRVQDSQGFCCTCDFLQTIGVSDSPTRATTLSCDLFTSQQSAHCLRFGELWYSAYAVGAAETFFTLELGVTSYVEGAENTEVVQHQEVLTLGPTSPGARSADGKIIARLLGDFARPAEAPALESKYFVVPSSPNTHERVRAGKAEWMLLDRSHFTMDGTQCNKIGVSYPAFRYESDRCGKRAGSCLGGQIDSYRAADQARITAGSKPHNMVSAYGDFSYVYAPTSGNHYIAYAWPGMQASVITLEMAADNVRFVTNNAPGEIDEAEVKDFEALSSDGLLVVVFTNVGTITADFTTTVDCADGAPDIMPVAAQRRSVRPYFSERLEFALHSTSPLQSDGSCVVRLFDALNSVTDETTVGFTTTALVDDRGAQDGEVAEGGPVSESNGDAAGSGAGGSGVFGAGGALCESQCPSFFDVKCFILLRCWGRIGRMVGVVASVLLGSLLLFKACMSPKVRGCVRDFACARAGGWGGTSSRAVERRSRVLDVDEGRAKDVQRDERNEHASRSPARRAPATPLPNKKAAAAHLLASPTTASSMKDSALSSPYTERSAAASRASATDLSLFKSVAPGEARAPPAVSKSPTRPVSASPAARVPCYLNLRAGAQLCAALREPGERFSLRGFLVRLEAAAFDVVAPDDRTFVFTLDGDDAAQHVHFCQELGCYMGLAAPAPIKAPEGSLHFTAAQVRALVSSAPLFECLNVAPEVSDEAEALHSA